MGLTLSPWANTASPAAKTLRAALMSRSCVLPQHGQVHERTVNGIFATVCPQSLHRLLEGNHLSTLMTVRPYHCALYFNCLVNSDQLASLIPFARRWFLSMFLTDSVSIAITWRSCTNRLISRVESLCKKSLRASAVLACIRATLRLAFLRLAEPLRFLESRRCSLASLLSFLLNSLGASIFSPVQSVAKCVSPKSMPISPDAADLAASASSQSKETWTITFRSSISVRADWIR